MGHATSRHIRFSHGALQAGKQTLQLCELARLLILGRVLDACQPVSHRRNHVHLLQQRVHVAGAPEVAEPRKPGRRPQRWRLRQGRDLHGCGTLGRLLGLAPVFGVALRVALCVASLAAVTRFVFGAGASARAGAGAGTNCFRCKPRAGWKQLFTTQTLAGKSHSIQFSHVS